MASAEENSENEVSQSRRCIRRGQLEGGQNPVQCSEGEL